MWMSNIVVFMLCAVACGVVRCRPADNPCDGIACHGGRSCAVKEDQSPVCVCLNQCNASYYNPVCGNDNRTYDSECLLRIQSCITNTTIVIRSYGTCSAKTVCDDFFCPERKSCRIDPEQNRPVCVCDLNCEYRPGPVCGSDGKIYGNACELQYHACQSEINITVASQGRCIPVNVCDGHTCPPGRHCAVGKDGQPICVCNTTCSDNRAALVCGSDDTTYISPCHLQITACLKGSNINVSHPGYCYKGSACDGFDCPAARRCTVDENNHPICVCRQICDSSKDLVCGSDGQTYTNECFLERTTCTQDANVTLAYKGVCKTDLCWGVECPTRMRCEMDGENSTRCVCAEDCGKYFYPVCGGDNQTYDNECEMEVAACKAGINTTKFLIGICPYKKMGCDNFRCPDDAHCEADAENRPSCVCNKICDYAYNPICGSDNRTYYNYCEYRRFACMKNDSVAISYYGTCESGHMSMYACGSTVCPFGSHCEYNGTAISCVCEERCPDVYAPVCGNDNKTYQSNCHLRMKVCANETSATAIRQQGTCENGPGCEGADCSNEKHCELDKNNKPSCVCNKFCPTYYDPWCGSDNKTYINDCELQKTGCLAKRTISRAFKGTCDRGPGCYDVICDLGRTCIVDENNRPHCVCSEQCYYWDASMYVCGSDNKTYAAVCLLRLAACLENKNISVVKDGKCHVDDLCNGFQCPTGKVCAIDEQHLPTCVCNLTCLSSDSLVCGSDNNTYLNLCELQKHSCLSNINVTLLHNGNCYKNSFCYGVNCSRNTVCAVTDKGPKCVCDQCPTSSGYSAVCGSNNVTYPSQCELQRSNCLTGTNTTQKTYEMCPFATNCDGVVCPSSTQCALDEQNHPTCVCKKLTYDNHSSPVFSTDHDGNYSSPVFSTDHDGNYSSPVFSTDGVTYSNGCELNRKACFASRILHYICLFWMMQIRFPL